MAIRVEAAVVLSRADCALLYEAARLRELRVRARGSGRLYTLLTDITITAFAHASSGEGNLKAEREEPGESGDMLTVTRVAARAGITPRAVRNHIAAGLLRAEKTGQMWVVQAATAEQYIAGRGAGRNGGVEHGGISGHRSGGEGGEVVA